MDISVERLFGVQHLDLTSPTKYILQIDRLKTINKYTLQLLKLYAKNNMMIRVQDLELTLDQDITEGAQNYAEVAFVQLD